MKINIITLGCSKNIVDSEHVAGHLRRAGYEVYFDRSRNDCDITIINTCGFIGDAKEESVNTILEQVQVKQRGRKQRRLYAIGCLVQRYRDELRAEIPEVDGYFGVHQWGELVNKLEAELRDRLEAERMQSTPTHYAYLKISEGCDRHCSYCAIPLIRGRHVSRPIDDIVSEAKRMVAEGVKELIVVAQDTTYYGVDLYGQRRLGELLRCLSEESGAEWIRLHYTYPTSFPTDAIDVIASHDNICKYIDIPLQHISTHLLRSMQRGIDREGTLRLLSDLRERIPGVAIRTTLIVGYPGETDADFDELRQFVAEQRFDRLGVFAYSPEEGTAAYDLGDPVPDVVKQQRLDDIMALQDSISLEDNQRRVGQRLRVVVDRREGDYWVCRSQYDSPEVDNEILVEIPSPHSDDSRMANSSPSRNPQHIGPGTFLTVEITSALEHDLMARVV